MFSQKSDFYLHPTRIRRESFFAVYTLVSVWCETQSRTPSPSPSIFT